MGLDIALGVLLLLGAIRGWFRGFVTPAVRLAALIGSAYAAAPIRDLARPHVAPYLQTIQPNLLDRMLWWASAAAAYLAVIGVAGLAGAIQRRQASFGEPESSHADQFAGMLLGAAKSAVVLVFVVAGFERYAQNWARTIPWLDRETRTSRVLAWNRQYEPADQIWTSPPVRQFVAHVHRMGIQGQPGADSADETRDTTATAATPAAPAAPVAELPPVQTAASRPPRLSLPDPVPPPDPTADDFLHAFDRALERVDAGSPKR